MTTYLFRRFAGSFQLRIRTFDDLVGINKVPEAHWIATACPTKGLSCDAKFIAYLDSDNDGRVRAQELRSAITWTASMLSEPKDCVPGSEDLQLAHMSSAAAPLKATAELILQNLGVTERTHINLVQVRQTKDVLNRVAANGDGIITSQGITDPILHQVALDILGLLPGVIDRSGERGIDRAMLAQVTTIHAQTLAWLDAEEAAKRWGADSVAMATLVRQYKPKLEEYFLQCRLVAAQPSALDSFRLTPQRLEALLGDDVGLRAAVEALPLMLPDPSGVLVWSSLVRGIDFEGLHQLRDQVLIPVLGASVAVSMTEHAWRRMVSESDGILAWADQAANLPMLKLGAARVRAITSEQIRILDDMCVQDLELNNTLERAGDLEKLILFQRWLFTFANNFVAMPELYSASGKALFEQGTLVMSGREFKLAVLVVDRAAHAAMAGEASMFILYCTITGGPGGAAMDVAVPVTNGTSRNLFVGKRGIFIGLDGGEYDAVVTQIITQPVSMIEAIYMPFVRIAKFASSRIEQWSKSSGSDFDQQLAQRVDNVKAAAAAGAAPAAAAQAAVPKAADAAAPAAASNQFGQLLMGGGIAFAAIGSAFALIVSQVSQLSLLQWIWGIIGLIGILALPSAILAWLKIYNRNLAVVLEASGWAMNDRLRLTRALGLLLTRRPARPPGSHLDYLDQVNRLIAANPEAAAELRRQRRQVVTSWLVVGMLALFIGYAWSGLLRTNAVAAAHSLSLTWLEDFLRPNTLTVSITSPLQGAALVAGSDVTITATAGQSNGSAIRRVDIYQGETLVGSSLSNPCSVVWANVPAGSHALTAKATDANGAVTTSAAVTVTVSSVVVKPPVVPATPAAAVPAHPVEPALAH